MKAWLSHAPGGPRSLRLQTIADPVPGAGQLLVRVLATGVNYPDVLLIRDRYQVKAERPFSPGAEVCGTVQAVGAGVVRFKPGDRVIGRCGSGGLAELVALDEARCIHVPKDMQPEQAAGFLFAYATAYHALRDVAHLGVQQSLLVLGAAGGVGSAAVDLGRVFGARVLVAASSPQKLAHALTRGASRGIVYSETIDGPDASRQLSLSLKELAGPEGVDVVFDPVGGAYSEAALRCLAPGGRHLVVGFAAGIPRLPLNLVLLKRCQVLGVDWRSFVMGDPAGNERNTASLMALWREAAIRPEVQATFPFEVAPRALELVEQRQAMGKLVVRVSQDEAFGSGAQ